MTDWLPDKYEMPEVPSDYTKLRVGENKIRILSKPIMGSEYWVNDAEGKRKPIRKRPDESIPVEFAEFAKHFWAMAIFNYRTGTIQVLEVTQRTIMKALTSLGRNKAWGSPLDYDIVVTRTGEGLESEYELLPEPKKELDKEIAKKWQELQDAGFDLERLYEGGHPHPSSNPQSDSKKPVAVKPDDKKDEVDEIKKEAGLPDLSDIPF